MSSTTDSEVSHSQSHKSQIALERTELKKSAKSPELKSWHPHHNLWELMLSPRIRDATKFGLVGTFGILVNEAAIWLFTDPLGMFYIFSAVVSSQLSITSNFALNEIWVFNGRTLLSGRLSRFIQFDALASSTTLILRIPLLWFLTSYLGIYYLTSNLLSIILTFTLRFLVADSVIWKTPSRPRAA